MERVNAIPKETDENHLVWQFFGRAPTGVFVEVGANHPRLLNQTWLLEQNGWSGVLVEPNPKLCELLRTERPRSRVIQAAAGAVAGEVDLLLGVSDGHSTVAPVLTHSPLSGDKVRVKLRPLDDILADAGVTRVDFLSIDVEGFELEVLRGCELKKYSPRLILLEEHRRDYKKHFHLRRQGYRLVRRTGLNNWYVPETSSVTVGSLNTWRERWQLFRKMWLNAAFDIAYRKIRRGFR